MNSIDDRYGTPGTIAGRLAETQGRPTGFDYLRLCLAFSVLWMHSIATSYGQDTDVALWTTSARPVLRAILPMFFALSGFLVAGSLERTRTIGLFLALRGIRVYPALTVEVLLSAFVLGPLCTSLSLRSYFTNMQFYEYLFNVTGHIHYFLPGTFDDNPNPKIVNAQLWTVPYELYCYASIAFLFFLGLLRHKILAPIGAFGITVAYLLSRLWKHGGWGPTIVGGLPGPMLIACFLFGVTIFFYRGQIACRGMIFWGALILAAGSLWFLPGGELIAPLPLAYVTVYLGLRSPRRVALIRGADYSYGVFLYGYTIQQSFASLGAWTHHWYLNILFCTPTVAFFAAMSWHCVEKPALLFRKTLDRLETSYLYRRDLTESSSVPSGVGR